MKAFLDQEFGVLLQFLNFILATYFVLPATTCVPPFGVTLIICIPTITHTYIPNYISKVVPAQHICHIQVFIYFIVVDIIFILTVIHSFIPTTICDWLLLLLLLVACCSPYLKLLHVFFSIKFTLCSSFAFI